MNALERFLAAGPDRRAALENAMAYYVPPELRAWLGVGAELNPVVSIERAGQGAERIADPSVQGWDRVQAYGDTASNMAATIVPMIAGGRGAVPAAQAAEDALMGWSTAAGVPEFMADEFGGVGFADDVASRGAQIMQMLRSGRGADVTDDMLDMGDPVANARLNEWLFNNYDLPMNAAARAARAGEMGMVPEFHGTSTGMDMRYPSAGYGSGSRKGIGFVTSDDAGVANTYADPSFGGVFPMMNATPPSGLAEIDARGALWSEIPREVEVRLPDGSVVPLSSYAQGPADVGGVYSTNQIARGAGFRGDGGVRVEGVSDNGFFAVNSAEKPGPSTVTFRQDTRGMRSRFARFDPRLAHLRNLSAGGAGLVFMSEGMQPEEEPRNALSGYLESLGL